MAGMHKKPEDRKSYHLRVPLTPGQRALLEQAVHMDHDDKAGWACAVLISAAKRTISAAKRTIAQNKEATRQ